MVTNNSGTAKNSHQGGGPNTGLIAGLTTGLVCAALIALTAALLIYRKRKRAQMTDTKTSPESPASPHTEIVMTAPSKAKVPPMPVPAAPVAAPAVDHYQDQSRYIGSPLFIPPLSATTSTINAKQPTTTTTTTIQRSLTLSARPQYDPALAINTINRSSSVKVTKYDHNPPVLDDDDLDHVQIRRAISVKRRNAAAHSAYLAPSATRSSSLRSQKAAKVSTTIHDEKQDDTDDDSLDEATPTSSGAIQVVCAKPAIARIRSISRKDSGKKPNKDPIKPSQDPQPLERMSMRSMPDSTHSSILADGEITVYWQPPSN